VTPTRPWPLQEAFAKYAQERSDCGSYAKGGDLGLFGPGMMQKEFEDGTRATPVGQMSGIVSGDIISCSGSLPRSCRNEVVLGNGSDRRPCNR
jgi:hypothetical protein